MPRVSVPVSSGDAGEVTATMHGNPVATTHTHPLTHSNSLFTIQFVFVLQISKSFQRFDQQAY